MSAPRSEQRGPHFVNVLNYPMQLFGGYTMRNNRHLYWLAGLFLILVAPSLAGCDGSKSKSVAAKPTLRFAKPTLRFAQLPIADSTVTHLAEAKGYLDEAGLSYTAVSVPAGPDAVTSLRARGQGGATAAGIALTPVVTMVGAKDEPVILATTLQSNFSAQLITSSGTGITSDPGSLRGKRIGVVRNTVGDIYLYKLLRKGDLGEADVVLVNARPPELRALFVRGDVDAVILWDPFLQQAAREYRKLTSDKKEPSRGEPVVLVDPSLHTQIFNIVTTRQKLSDNREAFVRLLRALIRAERYIADDRAVAQAEAENWLNLQKGDLDDVFAKTEYRVHLNVPLLSRELKEQLEWLKLSRPDTYVPDNLSVYIDTSLLKEIDPDRVQD